MPPELPRRDNLDLASLRSDDVFARIDTDIDTRFYDQPRFVQHIDDRAIHAVTDAIRRHVAPRSDLLDLRNSWMRGWPNNGWVDGQRVPRT